MVGKVRQRTGTFLLPGVLPGPASVGGEGGQRLRGPRGWGRHSCGEAKVLASAGAPPPHLAKQSLHKICKWYNYCYLFC